MVIISIIGIIGVINGIILSAYIWFVHSKKNQSEKYLALLMFLFSVRMTKSIISSIVPVNFWVIHIGLAAFTCVGPILLLYFQSSSNPGFHIKVVHMLHFVPAIIVLLCGLTPYPESDPVWNTRYNLIMLQIFTYIILSWVFFNRITRHRVMLTYSTQWYFIVAASVTLIWVAYGATWWLGIVPYLSGTFLFCFVVYIMYFMLLRKKYVNESLEKYKLSLLSKTESKEIFCRLTDYMNQAKPFLGGDITLAKLAALINTKPHILSQVINENDCSNFFEYINKFRIEEVKHRFRSTDYSKYTIAAIAYDCGYNSISAFNTAFKKIEKASPSDYRKKSQLLH